MCARTPCGAVLGMYMCLYTVDLRRGFPAICGVDLCEIGAKVKAEIASPKPSPEGKGEGKAIGRLNTNYLILIIMDKKKLLKAIIMALIAALTALATGLGLTSCNVTRVITNESQYLQRGDTSVIIQTKTVETYDAKKK